MVTLVDAWLCCQIKTVVVGFANSICRLLVIFCGLLVANISQADHKESSILMKSKHIANKTGTFLLKEMC